MWTPADPLPEAFFAVARRVYAGDPHWIPEDAAETARLFDASNPYFARARATVATAGDAARLAGFFDPALRIDGPPAAFFGFWETTEDESAHRHVFAEVEAWAQAQGAARLYGPVDFNTYRRYRIRLAAEAGAGCFPGEPYNPPYYASLLESAGYHLAASYVTQASSRPYADVVAHILAAKAGDLAGSGLRMQPLTPDFWMDHLNRLYPLVDAVFGQNFAYTPVSFDAFRTACGAPFARRLCPHTSRVVLDAAGDVAGFFLGFPDYAPLLRQGNPDRLRLADIRYDVHFARLERPTFLAKTLGVHPRYRQRGLLGAMATEAVRCSLDRYYDGMICLMKSDNVSTRFGLPFADRLRTYGLFAKDL